jgi:hypothetical protein
LQIFGQVAVLVCSPLPRYSQATKQIMREDPIVSSDGKATTSPSHQYHALNLLAGTFGALFRSSLPLLLNFDDSFNMDLLGNDDELLTLGKRLKLVYASSEISKTRSAI